MKKNLLLLAMPIIFALIVSSGVSEAGDDLEIFVQMGHSDFATSVAWSPDGRYAVSLSGDKTIKIWETSTGREIRTLGRHEYNANSAVFSPDGRYILSGGAGDIKLWETATGKEITSYPGEAESFAFSPDGRYALSASNKTNGIRLWELSTGKSIRTLQGHSGPVISVKFSPGGRYALSGSADSTARLWDVSTGMSLHVLSGHSDAVFSVAFSPNGLYAISGSSDKTVRFWEVSSGRIIRTLQGHSAGVISVAFSPDGKNVLSASIDQVVKRWEVSTGREISSVPVDFSFVSGVAFSPDGQLVMSGSGNRIQIRDVHQVKLWDVKTGQLVRTFQGYSSSIRSAVFSPDGKQVLTGNGESLNLWDAQAGRAVYTVKAHSDSITSVACSPDGHYAVSGSLDKNIKLWELSTGKELRTFQGHRDSINSVAFSPDGRHVLSGSWDRTVRLWEIETGRELKRFENPAAGALGFTSVVFSPDGKYVLSRGGDGIQLWEVSTGKELSKFHNRSPSSYPVSVSPDGRYALSGDVMDAINLWEISTGTKARVFKGRFGRIEALAFSPDGRYALSGTEDKSVRLWDVSTGREIKRFLGHSGFITSVGFSPDGKYALSGCTNGTTRIWDIATGGEVCTMVGFNDGEWIAITPEGYYNSSLKGHKYLNIRQGGLRVYGIDQFYDVFYRPDIVNAKLNGENISGLVTITIEDAIKSPPPAVEFTAVPKDTDSAKVKVCYWVKNMGGGIGEVRLFHNGKLIQSDGFYREMAKSKNERIQLSAISGRSIYEDMRGIKMKGSASISPIAANIKGDAFTNCRDVDAISGENELSVTAFNSANTVQSYMQTVSFNSKARPADAHLYILAIGINRYRDAGINLNYAVKDSIDIQKKFISQAATIYLPRNIHHASLTDRNATKPNIMAKISELAQKIKPTDSFVMFVAGHGVLLQNQYYMLTHDFNGTVREESMISSNEIVEVSKKIKSLSQLFIFDTCHAGGVDTIVSGLYDARMSVLAKKMGLHIYASASDKQSALDGYKGNGLFTYTLLSGLNNNREADKNKDGKVTIVGLGEYSKKETTNISKEIGNAQTPLIINFGKDSPIYKLH
jgi:WD40 repeat protein